MKKLSGKIIALIVVLAVILIIGFIVVGKNVSRNKAVEEIEAAFPALVDDKIAAFLEENKDNTSENYAADYVLLRLDYEIQNITYEDGRYTIWLDIFADCKPSLEWEQAGTRLKWEKVIEYLVGDVEDCFIIGERTDNYFDVAGYRCSYELPLVSKYTEKGTTSYGKMFFTRVNGEMINQPLELKVSSDKDTKECQVCGQKFKNGSENAKSIEKTNMCANCYDNFQWGNEVIGNND